MLTYEIARWSHELAARAFAKSREGERTPDGAPYSISAIYHAMEGMEP